MKRTISPPPVLFERHQIRSGPIERTDGAFQDYGVIFTSSTPTSPGDLSTQDLLGATLENIDLRGIEENRFFTILGGYYFQKTKQNGQTQMHVSHIFGDARESSRGFPLKEGDNILGDFWEMKDLSGDKRKSYLDERKLGGSGWTLLVTYKPERRQYPFSGRSMEIVKECPEIDKLTLRDGPVTPETKVIRAAVHSADAANARVEWDWGDGSPLEITDTLRTTHTYERPEGQASVHQVTASLLLGDGCRDAQSAEVTIEAMCPEIRVAGLSIVHVDDAQSQVDIKLESIRGVPTTFNWNWGDGTAVEQTDVPQASHVFPRSFEATGKYTIQIESTGPDNCRAVTSIQVQIPPPPCPEISSISVSEVTQDAGDQVIFDFEVQLAQGTPESYVWNWGDGSPLEETTDTQIRHHFQRPAGDAETYVVKVTANGPSSCSTEGETKVEVAGVCPVVGIDHIQLTDEQKGAIKATVSLQVNGPAPDQFIWDWGDGSPAETTTTATHVHVYERPAGDGETYELKVDINGPDSCTTSLSHTIEIAGRCPVITNLNLDVAAPTTDTFPVHAKARISGPVPESYHWDWGDGSPLETTNQPAATHVYTGKYGDAQNFEVNLEAEGPDSCKGKLQQDLHLPALSCPTIGRISYSQELVGEQQMKVSFTLGLVGKQPESFGWEFGDGTPTVTTKEPKSAHVYTLPIGDAKSYQVSVTGSGPGSCKPQDSLTISIPGVCPKPKKLDVALPGETGENEVQVAATLEVGPGQADQYIWDWGDGSDLEKTDTPTASHTYTRTYGDGKEYQLTVSLSGPGSCGDSISTLVHIPGKCPTFGVLDVQIQSTDRTSLEVKAELALEDGKADHYIWNWGDGSPEERTDTPTASHTYARTIGSDASYQLQVEAIGPDSCNTKIHERVTVPAGEDCPALLRIDRFISTEDNTQVTYAFAPVLQNGTPDRFIWDFGDGSAEETTDEPTIYHTYQLPTDSDEEYTVKLRMEGPADCTGNGEVRAEVAKPTAPCPKLTEIKLLAKRNASDTITEVDVEAIFEGEQPDRFVWSWKKGTPELVTTSPNATLPLPRSAEADIVCIVTLRTSGPGDCSGEVQTKIDVPQQPKKKPAFCGWMPYLMAFLGAMLVGTLVICYAAEILGRPVEEGGSPWVIGTTISSFFLFVVGVIAWFMQGNKYVCPPTSCNWLAVGWVSMISGLIVSFFILPCFENSLVVPIVFFVLTGGFAFFWFRKCSVNTPARVFFTYFGMSLLAAAICSLLIAANVMAC